MKRPWWPGPEGGGGVAFVKGLLGKMFLKQRHPTREETQVSILSCHTAAPVWALATQAALGSWSRSDWAGLPAAVTAIN